METEAETYQPPSRLQYPALDKHMYAQYSPAREPPHKLNTHLRYWWILGWSHPAALVHVRALAPRVALCVEQ